MPTPTRTTHEQIVAAARSLVDEAGQDALTMQAVAARVGVRAPSLYKRVESRDALLGLVVESVAIEAGRVLDAAVATAATEPAESLAALARAFRGYAHEHPHLFGLLFAPLPDAARQPRETLQRSSAAILRAAEQLAGEDHALDAARTVTAWAFGFLRMELSGAFQLGGDPGAAFDFGVAALARALDVQARDVRVRGD